jgi:GNAT superfamily N-acetyltransferase
MIAVRAAVAADYDAYVPLFAELGVDDPIPSRERFASELIHRMVVATVDGTVVGYALYELLADTGYIRNLVSAFTHRRRGIGAALMESLRARFTAAGATQWCLNVKPDNLAAIALYTRCGLTRAYASCALRLPSSVELPAPPPDLALVPVLPSDDATVEPTFRLLRGQLASSRAKAGRELLQLRRGAELLGLAVFSPSIPGAFPFQLLDPTLAAPFLALLRPHVPAGAPHLQVSIEHDDALRAAVLALGAHVHLEIEHMRGPL